MNERVLRLLLRVAVGRPRLVLFLWLAIVVSAFPALLKLQIGTSLEAALDRTDPRWQTYQDSVREFGGDEVLVVALHSPELFDRRMLAAVRDLTTRLESIPGVQRVDSLATVALVQSLKDGSIDFDPPLAKDDPLDAQSIATLRGRLLADWLAPGTLVSRDQHVVALTVRLDPAPPISFGEIVDEVRKAAETRSAWISGVPVFRAEVNRKAELEIRKFVVLTVVVIGAVLLVTTRSVALALAALAAGSTGAWFTLAALGACGTPLTLVTVILPSLMIALGCAYSVHLIAAARGGRGPAQIADLLMPVVQPTALSGFTTAISFLAIAAVRIDVIRQVGSYGSLGALVVTAAALTIVPAALVLRPVALFETNPDGLLNSKTPRWCDYLARRHGRAVIAIGVMLTALCSIGLFRIQIDTNVPTWFPPGSEVRDSYDRIHARLAGISPMNVVIRSRHGSVVAPEVLSRIDAFVAYLRERPKVGKVIALTEPLRQLHVAFSGVADSGLPESQALISQYLLLLDSVSYTRDLLSRDRRATNIMLRINNSGSRIFRETAADAERWWNENGAPETDVAVTGIMFEFARSNDEIVLGQIRGLAWALGAITILMLLIYRTPGLVFVAIVPNVLPLALVFGLLGLAGRSLDAGMVVSSCLVLGIAVDGTLHVMKAYTWYSAAGDAREVALRRGLRRVVRPLVQTTVTLGLGFGVLVLSDFAFVRNLGVLVIAVMCVCLVADLLLLPALLLQRGAPAVGKAGGGGQ